MSNDEIQRIWDKLDDVCTCVQSSASATREASEAARMAATSAHDLQVIVASIQTDVSWLKESHSAIFKACVTAIFSAAIAIVFMALKVK